MSVISSTGCRERCPLGMQEAVAAPGHEWVLLEDIRDRVLAAHPQLSVRTVVRPAGVTGSRSVRRSWRRCGQGHRCVSCPRSTCGPCSSGTRPSGAPLYRQWEQRSLASLEDLVGPFRDEFPGVAVTVVRDHGHAADVLTDHAGDPRLIVLGRDDRNGAPIGLGAVAREVLNNAEVPVLVVPVARLKGHDRSAPMSDSTAGAT